VSVARGYRARAVKTAAQFVELPGGGARAYRTGDQATLLPTGSFMLLGRLDNQVKIVICSATSWVNPLAAPRSNFVCARIP
jgi:non-ribosomal peptide synthetase component F